MSYEVVVVGGGVGGLTAAALLAARGVNVCLLERQSDAGGCAATIEHGGHKFEPTHGLFSSWGAGGGFEHPFLSLWAQRPRIHSQTNASVLKLPGGNQSAADNT